MAKKQTIQGQVDSGSSMISEHFVTSLAVGLVATITHAVFAVPILNMVVFASLALGAAGLFLYKVLPKILLHKQSVYDFRMKEEKLKQAKDEKKPGLVDRLSLKLGKIFAVSAISGSIGLFFSGAMLTVPGLNIVAIAVIALATLYLIADSVTKRMPDFTRLKESNNAEDEKTDTLFIVLSRTQLSMFFSGLTSSFFGLAADVILDIPYVNVIGIVLLAAVVCMSFLMTGLQKAIYYFRPDLRSMRKVEPAEDTSEDTKTEEDDGVIKHSAKKVMRIFGVGLVSAVIGIAAHAALALPLVNVVGLAVVGMLVTYAVIFKVIPYIINSIQINNMMNSKRIEKMINMRDSVKHDFTNKTAPMLKGEISAKDPKDVLIAVLQLARQSGNEDKNNKIQAIICNRGYRPISSVIGEVLEQFDQIDDLINIDRDVICLSARPLELVHSTLPGRSSEDLGSKNARSIAREQQDRPAQQLSAKLSDEDDEDEGLHL